MRVGRHFPAAQTGFVFVYALAIVVFLTGVVLEGSRWLRHEAGLATRHTERLAAEARLDAAAAWLKARLEIVWSQKVLEHPDLPNLAALQPAFFELDALRINLAVEDADLRPDANLLMEAEWIRLFEAYGVTAETAQMFARQVLALRTAAGGEGFRQIEELTDSPWLPTAMVLGVERAGGEWLPPVGRLLSVGGKNRKLHIAHSALPLFAIFLEATSAQLSQLRDIRTQREATLADAQTLFGASGRERCYAGLPQRLRFRLSAVGTLSVRELIVSINQQHLKVEVL